MSPADFHPSLLKVGLNSTVKAIKKNSAELVFMAYDAEGFVKDKVVTCAEGSGVGLCFDYSMLQLGVLCGIEVPCAVCCALKAQ